MNACKGGHAWKLAGVSLGFMGVGETGYSVECKTCGTVEYRPGIRERERARDQVQDSSDPE